MSHTSGLENSGNRRASGDSAVYGVMMSSNGVSGGGHGSSGYEGGGYGGSAGGDGYGSNGSDANGSDASGYGSNGYGNGSRYGNVCGDNGVSGQQPPSMQPQPMPTCPRHPGVVSYVRCQRCARPACPQCQRPASVGVHCVDCVAAERRNSPAASGGVLAGTSSKPVVTIGIIVICALVWIGEITSSRFFADVAFVGVWAKHQPWRFITSGFAHDASSPLHLAFNMYALFVVGQYLEPTLGRLRFTVVYLLSVLGGSVGYLLLTSPPTPPDMYTSQWLTPMVGASGGVFGLFLAVVVVNRALGRDIRSIGSVIVLNAIFSIVIAGIAWQAHLGGALIGALSSWLFLALRKRPTAIQYGVMAALAIALFALAYARYASVDLSQFQ